MGGGADWEMTMILHPWSEGSPTHCLVVGTSPLQTFVGSCLVLGCDPLSNIPSPGKGEPLGLGTSWPCCGCRRWEQTLCSRPPELFAC